MKIFTSKTIERKLVDYTSNDRHNVCIHHVPIWGTGLLWCRIKDKFGGMRNRAVIVVWFELLESTGCLLGAPAFDLMNSPPIACLFATDERLFFKRMNEEEAVILQENEEANLNWHFEKVGWF